MTLYTKVFPTITSSMVFGTLLGVIKEHVISKLPKNFIKNTYITNSIASISEEYYDEDTQLLKRIPLLSLGVSFEYNPSDAEYIDVIRFGVKHVPKNTWLHPEVYTRFLVNEKDKVFITALNSRLKITLNAGIRVESEIQAMNLVSFLRNSIGIDRPYYISDVPMEIPIPLELLDSVFIASGIDKNDPYWQNKFSSFINTYSGGTIIMKKNLSTGNFVYYVRYKANLLTKISGMPSLQKNLEGKSVINTDVTWNFEVDLPFYSNFITENLIEEVDQPFISNEDNVDSIVYNYSFKKPMIRQLNKKDLIQQMEFLTEVNVKIDVTDFSDSLSQDLVLFIDRCLNESTTGANLEIMLWKDNILLNEGKDYEVDWKEKKITIVDPWYNYVYRLGIYISTENFVNFVESKKKTNVREILENGTL